MGRHFAAPAARQQGDDLRRPVQSQGHTRGRPVDLQRDGIRQRMSHELGPHAMLIIETLFKGQQAQHQIHRFMNGARPALTPGPHLRTDVLHSRVPGSAQIVRQPQIEFGGVDADEHIGFGGEEALPDVRPQTQQARQIAQDFEQPHDGQGLRRFPDFASRVLHLRTGNPEELGVRSETAQGADQVRAQRVAGRLSRHQTHTQWYGRGRRHGFSERCCVRCD
jgi:hypothetical protein